MRGLRGVAWEHQREASRIWNGGGRCKDAPASILRRSSAVTCAHLQGTFPFLAQDWCDTSLGPVGEKVWRGPRVDLWKEWMRPRPGPSGDWRLGPKREGEEGTKDANPHKPRIFTSYYVPSSLCHA